MSVFYQGSARELPADAKAETEAFIKLGIPVIRDGADFCPGFVTLGTRQGTGARLTVISLLSGSGLETLFMQVSLNSQKVQNLRENAQAEIAVTNGRGSVILTCTAEILTDPQIKAEKWEDWMAQYHPQGPASADYAILRFRPQSLRVML